MGEFISDQTTATTITNGDYLVFDTATGTFKITRQNLLGQIDTNTNNVDTNTGNISTNTGNISTNSADILALQNVGLKYTKVEVTPGEILTLNTAPVTLAPLTTGSYIQVVSLHCYYRHGSTAYSNPGNLEVYSGGYSMGWIGPTIITTPSDMSGEVLNLIVSPVTGIGGDLILQAQTSNPTGGDGSLNISIVYKEVV